jgi:type III secretory pathway component EscT
MTETDDKLLKQFFADNKQEMADYGFTHRVMRSLPGHYRHVSQVWSILLFAVLTVLFYVSGGVALVWETLRETFGLLIERGAEQLDPYYLAVAVIVLLVLGYRKIVSLV